MKRLFIIAVISITPLFAHAKEVTEWNFMKNNVPGRWEIKGLSSAQPSTVGLNIRTDTLGKMTRPMEVDHRTDAITLTYASRFPTEGYLLWHITGTPKTELVQYPFTFQQTDIPLTIELNLAPEDQWDHRTQTIGFAFPPGADVILQKVELTGWNPFEKILEASKSFWTFDQIRPYSINFLWGPQLTYNPIARRLMFSRLPPLSHSANRAFYILFAIAGAVLAFRLGQSKGNIEMRNAYLHKFVVVFIACWILFDVRMGAEIISYMTNDLVSYHAEEPSRQIFRERGSFMTFAQAIQPYVQEDEKYVFMTTARWPYLGLIRYHTYPTIPTLPTEAENGVRTWVVYERPDITINSNQQLEMEGKAISTPGRMIHEFADGTFVFRTNE